MRDPGVRLIGGMLLLIAVLVLVGQLIPLKEGRDVVHVPGGVCVIALDACYAR